MSSAHYFVIVVDVVSNQQPKICIINTTIAKKKKTFILLKSYSNLISTEKYIIILVAAVAAALVDDSKHFEDWFPGRPLVCVCALHFCQNLILICECVSLASTSTIAFQKSQEDDWIMVLSSSLDLGWSSTFKSCARVQLDQFFLNEGRDMDDNSIQFASA